ncbi:hypothetical protein IV60_GL001521 [Lancefieldella rimae]|uniref:Uncharacterized protein n=1 Tax=Lancefieldella rimae TaxID=1383 RepID=A0ABR5PYP4_9ACTN|nr:hypothetical protein IV60_GL001521 [Lancefieldella rimae]
MGLGESEADASEDSEVEGCDESPDFSKEDDAPFSVLFLFAVEDSVFVLVFGAPFEGAALSACELSKGFVPCKGEVSAFCVD